MLLQIITAVHSGTVDHILVHRVDEAVRGGAYRVLVPGAVHRLPQGICQHYLLGLQYLLPTHRGPNNPAVSRQLHQGEETSCVLLSMGTAHTDVPKLAHLHTFTGVEVSQ